MRKIREEQEDHNLDELFDKLRQAPNSCVFAPLADACRKIGRVDEALEICENGVRRHPTYPSGHVVRGKCLYDKGDREASREAFEQVLSLDENNLVALKYLGMIEADDGDLVAAGRHFQRILSLDPDNKEIKSKLRLVEEQEQIKERPEEPVAGDLEAVDEILGDAGSESVTGFSSRGDESPSPTAGSASLSSGSDPQMRVEDVETSDELASVTLADIFASQGYKSKAEKIYRELLRKQPRNDLVLEKLRALAAGERIDAEPEGTGRGGSALAAEGALSDEDDAKNAESPPHQSDEKSATPENAPDANSIPGAGASAGTRPKIRETDSLSHFRRWLTNQQK